MARWFSLNQDLFTGSESKSDSIKIVEESGATYLQLKIKLSSIDIPPLPVPVPPDRVIEDQNRYRQTRPTSDEIFGHTATISIEKFGAAPDSRAAILKFTAIISPKVPHTGG